jgi:hypothetical protein
MTKDQAQQIADFINSKPVTVFSDATVQHNIGLGDNGYYAEATNPNNGKTQFEDWAKESAMLD